MIIELYNGQKKFISLVQYYKTVLDAHGYNKLTEEPKKGYVAIPGGSNHNEQTVRKWAKEYGFRVKTVYEQGIDDAPTVPVS